MKVKKSVYYDMTNVGNPLRLSTILSPGFKEWSFFLLKELQELQEATKCFFGGLSVYIYIWN